MAPNTRQQEDIEGGNGIEIPYDARSKGIVEKEPRASFKETEKPGKHLHTPHYDRVSWFQQLYWASRKNFTVLIRRPIFLMIFLLSSVASVMLGWILGRDPDEEDVIDAPMDRCGRVDYAFYQQLNYTLQEKVKATMVEHWRYGGPVNLMGIGPMLNALIVFLVIQNELQLNLLGVLRALGLRDSVYWMSWYTVFATLALCNALLGAITAAIVPGHVYENVYFGGVLASLFLLQVALIPASFFLATICGSSGRRLIVNFMLLVILAAAFIPAAIQSSQSDASEFSADGPAGLFWSYASTERISSIYDWETNTRYYNQTCNEPLMDVYQGELLKDEAQRDLVQEDEYFIGCFTQSSFGTNIYAGEASGVSIAKLILFWFPYFHFSSIWGHFVGYVAMPGHQFTASQASLSESDLASEVFPLDLDPDLGSPSTMAPQGSLFALGIEWALPYKPGLGNCPSTDREGANICPYVDRCNFSKLPGPVQSGPSTNDLYWTLFALSLIYLVFTSYWAQVILAGNGRREKPWFFLLPNYWLESKSVPLDPSDSEGHCIVVNDVKKSFGDFDALSGVSFQMRSNEITALLGHNGAGKSTLSNILCCEIPATEGDITVFGRSVKESPHGVRQLVGLCKQDDYLWPNLTAREHLELFAGLRGVSRRAMGDIVQNWLESVDLDIVQHQRASQYSGGMKRRLSVALSTIGDRPVIVLDEPTTGMDPVSRRFVWRHLDAIKEGRVILMTTHAMEEADLLADEVAIIRRGELAALGSPLSLKAEHGTALQFSILVNDKTKIGEIESYIGTLFSTELADGYVDVDVSLSGNIVVKILKLRDEDNTTPSGVEVSKLSSFVSWLDDEESPVSEYGFSNSSLEEVFLKVTADDKSTTSGTVPDTAEDNQANIEGTTGVNDMASFNALSSFRPRLTVWNQSWVVFQDFWVRSWTGLGSLSNYIFCIVLIGCSLLTGYATANSFLPMLFNTVYVIFLSLILLTIIGPIYADRNEGQFYLMRSQGLLPQSYILGVSSYSLAAIFLYALLFLGLLFTMTVFQDPDVCIPSFSNDWCYNEYDYTFGAQQLAIPDVIGSFYDEYQGEVVELRAVRSPGGFGMMFGIIVAFSSSSIGAVLSTAFLPGYRITIFLIMIVVVGAGLAPFFAFNFGWDVNELQDCYSKLLSPEQCDRTFGVDTIDSSFLDCVGLDLNSDLDRQYCYQSSAGLLPQFGVYQTLTMLYSARIRFISETPGYVEKVLMPALSSKAKCNSNFCDFPLAADAYRKNLLFLFLGGVCLFALGVFLACLLAFPIGPFLKLRQAFSRIWDHVKTPKGSVKQDSNAKGIQELEEVNEERLRVAELVAPFVQDENGETHVLHSEIDRDNVAPVIMHKLRKVYPTIGGGKPKVALDSLDLHVPKGMVLGLLGKNGAGKTTALKILAGAHPPSSGFGLVSGYDSGVEQIQVFERLGNCAQFDCVWSGRTVQWHLEFFAKLKGLPRNKIGEISRAIATAVGLGSTEAFTRRAGQLSGGMRRRLSIAMALVGSPSVVILDEPTTGLDPSTRSTIWELIGSFGSNERSMIITTHMMIEADTLCNQIAIVGHGKLKVVGSQQVLKNNYGSGYVLQLNLVKSTQGHQDRAISFVRKHLHPDAVLGIRQAKTLHMNLPRDLKLDRVFQALYSKERVTEGCINQFLLSQSSLEDVFIALGD